MSNLLSEEVFSIRVDVVEHAAQGEDVGFGG